jgi:hypothetical protein
MDHSHHMDHSHMDHSSMDHGSHDAAMRCSMNVSVSNSMVAMSTRLMDVGDATDALHLEHQQSLHCI